MRRPGREKGCPKPPNSGRKKTNEPGYLRVRVLVHPDDKAKVIAYAEGLRIARQQG